MVARAAMMLVKDGSMVLERDPDPGTGCWVRWDDHVIARIVDRILDGDMEEDSEVRSRREAEHATEGIRVWEALKKQMSKEGWADEDGADDLEYECKWTLRESEVVVAEGGEKRKAEETECKKDEGEHESKRAKTA